jgi:hypothetical protein
VPLLPSEAVLARNHSARLVHLVRPGGEDQGGPPWAVTVTHRGCQGVVGPKGPTGCTCPLHCSPSSCAKDDHRSLVRVPGVPARN